MADHNPQHGRRPHFHRGRRGQDRRGQDRRGTTQREHPPESGTREAPRDNGGVDVEQIMRDIRARIAQRHGIELNSSQIQELAARRLEAILEPRNVKPQLLEQLRRSAGAAPELPASAPVQTYEFEESTLYETHRSALRFFRKLLNPILKLFFNPAPLIHALNTQVRINKELAARESERAQRQSEWNALQYELVQRVVLECARLSFEIQPLAAQIESLSTKVEFSDRRVRSLESPPATPHARQATRQQESPIVATPPVEAVSSEGASPGEGEGSRRRRRRRRGRRAGSTTSEAAEPAHDSSVSDDEVDAGDAGEVDEEDSSRGVHQSGQPSTGEAPERPLEPPAIPTHPSPPRDEPVPEHTVDHAEPGPEER